MQSLIPQESRTAPMQPAFAQTRAGCAFPSKQLAPPIYLMLVLLTRKCIGVNVTSMNTSRRYQMSARADGVRETRTKIVAAAGEAILTTDYSAITLEAISSQSGVSVQTIIRHFGSKEGLLREAFEAFTKRIDAEMRRVEVGDIAAAIEALHARYEWMGDANVRMLAQEESPGLIAEGMKTARKYHRQWVERIFEPYLPPSGAARRKRLYQFLIVCDVYTWKLIRRDHRGSRAATTEAVVELANAIVRYEGKAP